MRRAILWAGGARVFTVGVALLLAVMLWLVATTLPTAKATPGSTITVSVPANKAWTDTGVDLQNGDQVRIQASGIIRITPSDPGKSPDGDQNCVASNSFVAPGLHCYALIGGIGGYPPQEVGKGGTFKVSLPKGDTGRLYLGVNDDYFEDNSGSWTARITVTHSGTGQPGSGNSNNGVKIELPLERTWREPAGPYYANHCGPGATQVALDARLPADEKPPPAWVNIDTIADQENTVRNGTTYMDQPNTEHDIVGVLNMHLKLNNDPNPNWYEKASAKDQKDFEGGILRNLKSGYAVITGVNTAGMPGWENYTAKRKAAGKEPGVLHVVTVVGFSQTANGAKYVKYVDTAGPDSGYDTKGTSPEHTIPLSEFWTYINNKNNVQAWGPPTPKK